MLIGAIWAWRRRDRWRRAILTGAAIAVIYVGARVVVHEWLLARVSSVYSAATRVDVFPVLLRPFTWRFVAVSRFSI